MYLGRAQSGKERQDEGYVFVGVIILVALLVIFMAIAAPRVRDSIRRDQELETIHRGHQYIRAVQLYYRRFRRYPPNVDALADTNGVRFLRRKYLDPLTGQDDWKPVLLGQNHAPLAMGYFGQVLDLGAAAAPNPTGSAANGIFGTPPASAYDSFNNSSGASGQDTGSGQNPQPNQMFGGGGMIGVSPPVAKASIVIYKTKAQYDAWEFVYDPILDHMMQPLLIPPAANGPPTNTGAPGVPIPAPQH